jgi:hypothetical protein
MCCLDPEELIGNIRYHGNFKSKKCPDFYENFMTTYTGPCVFARNPLITKPFSFHHQQLTP